MTWAVTNAENTYYEGQLRGTTGTSSKSFSYCLLLMPDILYLTLGTALHYLFFLYFDLTELIFTLPLKFVFICFKVLWTS